MQQLMAKYADGYRLITEAIAGLSEEQLLFKPAPNAWSIKEIVVHLADTEIVAVHRMKAVLSEEEPLLTAFDQDAWANRQHYLRQDLRQQLALFKLLRESFVPVLQQASEQDWARVGVHNQAGRLTLKDLVTKFTDHVDSHIRQIDRVKADSAFPGK